MSVAAISQALPADLRAEIVAEVARAPRGEAPLIPGRVYGRRLARDRGRRRAIGTYYTPEHLVDFIVDRTLAPLLAAGTRLPRVLDPACGAGVFLLGALRWLVERTGESPARVARECLCGVDLDPVAVELSRSAVELAAGAQPELAVGNALLGSFPLAGPFDAVIGNPPWGQKGYRWSDEERALVRARYACGRGVVDPYALFVERAIELAARWGMVLPDIILLKNQQDVRDVILERCAMEHIADSQRAFPGAVIDTVVIVAGRRRAGPEHAIDVWHSLPADWRARPPATLRVRQALFSELPGHKFNIRLTPEARALWRRLDEAPRLGDFFEAHEGVHTGNARDKLFRAQREHDDCVPVIVGRDEVRRFAVAWAGRWLDRSPGALDRAAGDYANLGRRAWHERPKILVRRTGDRVVAAFDERGLHCSNNLFVVLPRVTMDEREQRGYVALLNSQLLTWYFRTVQPRAGRLFPELKIHHLLAFPVPSGVAALAELREEALDRAVFEAFGLDGAEIATVTGSRAPADWTRSKQA